MTKDDDLQCSTQLKVWASVSTVPLGVRCQRHLGHTGVHRHVSLNESMLSINVAWAWRQDQDHHRNIAPVVRIERVNDAAAE